MGSFTEEEIYNCAGNLDNPYQTKILFLQLWNRVTYYNTIISTWNTVDVQNIDMPTCMLYMLQ